MRRLRAWLFRLCGLFDKERRDQELVEEIESHIQMHTEDNLRSGMTPEEARRDALIKLGGIELTKENYRDRRSVPMLETLIQDLRYGLRMLRRNPGFTAVAVLTLALGIGTNTAIFSVVNAVLLRGLPYDQPDQLVQLWEDPGGKGQERRTVSGPVFAGWKEQNTVLENLSAVVPVALNLTGEGLPERLRGLRVSGSYLPIFRVQPLLGRGFLPDEDQPGKNKVVILTHGLWQRRFGGDMNLIGRTVRFGSESRTVVGILPPRSPLSSEREFLIPFVFGSEPRHRDRGDRWLRVVARLKPGVTMEQAREGMNAIMQGIAFELRLHIEGVEAALGQPLNRLIAVGGGARSPLWCQIIADICGKPVFRAGTSEATALGAGILAATGAGLYPDVLTAARAMANVSCQPFLKDSKRQTFYEQIYQQVYRHLFPALQHYLDTLSDLIGS